MLRTDTVAACKPETAETCGKSRPDKEHGMTQPFYTGKHEVWRAMRVVCGQTSKGRIGNDRDLTNRLVDGRLGEVDPYGNLAAC